LLFFFSLTRRPLFPTLFPYTTLFRSGPQSSSERTRSSLQRKLLPHRDHSHDRRIGLHHAFHRTARRLRTGEGSMKRISGVMIGIDRKSTRLNSSHVAISYAVFCLKKK